MRAIVAVLMLVGFVAAPFPAIAEDQAAGLKRQQPMPFVEDFDEPRADVEWVATVIRPRTATAAFFVPILRPMLPREAHLVAHAESNSLLLIAPYAQAKHMATIIAALDEHAVPQEK